MNERIQELAKQAFGSTIDTDPILVYEAEKFAELIIQDCVTKCDAVQTMYGQYTFTARKCKEAIKEHFGVQP